MRQNPLHAITIQTSRCLNRYANLAFIAACVNNKRLLHGIVAQGDDKVIRMCASLVFGILWSCRPAKLL